LKIKLARHPCHNLVDAEPAEASVLYGSQVGYAVNILNDFHVVWECLPKEILLSQMGTERGCGQLEQQ
jgi:hypothetical protein